MKNLKIITLLIAVFILFVKCENESIIDSNTLESNVPNEEIMGDKIDILTSVNEAILKNNYQNRDAIEFVYTGELCGLNITGMYADATAYQSLHHYFFNGYEGDIISIYVPRTTVGFDSAFTLYFGTVDTELQYIISRDDNISDSFGGCYSDPYIDNFALPYTGTYTLVVHEAAHCGYPMGYEIITTGINCNDADFDGCLNEEDPYPRSIMTETILIEGIDTGVENVFENCGTMADEIQAIIYQTNSEFTGDNYYTLHKKFYREVSKLTYYWYKDRKITSKERTAIGSAAWNATVPYYTDF
jgi:hypothetical protein